MLVPSKTKYHPIAGLYFQSFLILSYLITRIFHLFFINLDFLLLCTTNFDKIIIFLFICLSNLRVFTLRPF